MKTRVKSLVGFLRNEHGSVMKNFFSLSMLKGMEYLAPLILVPYLIRVLGIERYGVIQSVLSYIYIFLIITNYGFNYSAARQISIHRDNQKKSEKIAGAIIILKSMFMVLSFVLMIIGAFLFPNLRSELGLVLITFGFIIGDVLFPVWLFQGYEKMYFLSRFQIVARLSMFILTLLLIKSPADYILYPAIYYGTQIIMGITSLVLTPKLLGIRFAMPTLSIIKNELTLGLKPFVSSVAQVLYTQPRIFYLSLFADPLTTGTFAVADRASGVIQLFPVWLFVVSALPRLSYMYEQDPLECKKTITMYQRWTTIYILLLIPLILYFAPQIIYAFSGTYNESATWYFRLLCMETVLLTTNVFSIHYFAVSGKYNTFSKIYIVTCIVTLLAFSIILPIAGPQGLAFAIIGSAALLAILTRLELKKAAFENS